MKAFNKILAIILILIIPFSLCSCSANTIEVNLEQNSDNYIHNEDCQNYLGSFSPFVKADDEYYFISGSILFYYDTEQQESYPVCNKTNCTHSDSDCTAYLSPLKFYPGMSMYYYDNALYLLGHEGDGLSHQQVYMYQISLDNFKQKKAAYLFDGTSGISVVCTMHRGYIYFANCLDQMEETTAELYRVKLGDISENSAEKIFEFSAIGADIASLSAYGNNLFFNTSSFEDKQGNGSKSVLNYINIHTLETRQLPERKYSHFADENKVYYFKNENTVISYDLNKNESEPFCDINGPCYISADDNYIYFDNLQSIIVNKTSKEDRKIFVYDKNGNFVTEIIPNGTRDNCYFGGNDVMIFENVTEGEVVDMDSANNYYVLDKSQLTSPDKQFINME